MQRSRDARGDTEREPVSEEAAKALALRMLAARAYATAELDQALTRRGVPAEVRVSVLGRLTELRLLDDASYAEAFVRSRHRDRGLGRRALSRELHQRGVETEVAAAAVAEVDDDAELAAACSLVRRRAAALSDLPEEVRVRRLLGMLARRGYSGALAGRAVREALSADVPYVDG